MHCNTIENERILTLIKLKFQMDDTLFSLSPLQWNHPFLIHDLQTINTTKSNKIDFKFSFFSIIKNDKYSYIILFKSQKTVYRKLDLLIFI